MEELDLKELFKLFWSKKAYIIVIVAIAIVVGVMYSYILVSPNYKSAITLVLAKTNESETNTVATTGESITQTDVSLNQKLVSTYSELVKSKTVIRQVITNLNIEGLDEEYLRKSITVSSVKDTELIEITVTNANPEYAAKIANEIANVFTAKVAEIYNINNVYVVDKAEVANGPYNISHIKDLIIFAFVGTIIACLYVLIANMLDTTIKSQQDVGKCSGLLVIAQIPEYDFEIKVGGGK